MISIFERFDDNAREIYNSMKNAGVSCDFVVLDDDGFLPDDILTPYRFFSGYVTDRNSKGLYFNEVDIPKHWSIEGTNSNATVYNMDQRRAEIFYRKGYRNRIVCEVAWLDRYGQVIYRDYYNQEGYKFAQKTINKDNDIFVRYLDSKGNDVIYQNRNAQSFILTWKGKDHFFENAQQFHTFFLKEAGLNQDSILINSLAAPLSLLVNLESTGKGYLFFQEDFNEVPGNLMFILNNKTRRDFEIIIPSEIQYKKLIDKIDRLHHDKIHLLGYNYHFVKDNQYSNNALIVTNSDQIPGLEVLVEQLTEFKFHIAALTEMSDKLMAMDKYPNVHLYPNISPQKYEALYDTCDLYLDINEGTEVMCSIRKAFDHQMVIFGYHETQHQEKYIAPEHVFSVAAVEELVEALKMLRTNVDYNAALNKQNVHAGIVTDDQFKEQFETRK